MQPPKPEWQTLPKGFQLLILLLGLLSFLTIGQLMQSTANQPPPGIQRTLSRLLRKTCPHHTIQVQSTSPLKIVGTLECNSEDLAQIQSAISKLCQIDPQRGDSLSLNNGPVADQSDLNELLIIVLLLAFLPLNFAIDYGLFKGGVSQRGKRQALMLLLLSIAYLSAVTGLFVSEPVSDIQKKISDQVGNTLIVESITRNDQTNSVIALSAFNLAASEPGLRKAAQSAGLDNAHLSVLPIVTRQMGPIPVLLLLAGLFAPPALLVQRLIARYRRPATQAVPITVQLGPNLQVLTDLIRKRVSNLPGGPDCRVGSMPSLEPNSYILLLGSQEVGRGHVQPQQLLAVGPEERLQSLTSELTRDPIYGMPCKWIDPDLQKACEENQCTIFDSTTVVVTHIIEILRVRLNT